MTQSKKTHLPASNGLEPMWGEPSPNVPTQRELIEMDLAELQAKYPEQAGLTVYPPTPVEEETIGNWVNEPGKLQALPPVICGDPLEDAVETVADRCFMEAENLGWHKSYDHLKNREQSGLTDPGDIVNWISSKMLLVTGEVCEAQEELRNGRGITEVYYSFEHENGGVSYYDEQLFIDGIPQYKPEGWLVEMADALIRLNDLVGTVAGQEGVMFGPIVAAKLQYNATRGVMHGGKKF